MSKNILVSAGVALLVVVLGFAFFGPSENAIVAKVVEIVKALKFGAFPGSDFGNCITVNGYRTCSFRVAMDTGTSTQCVINLPALGMTSTSTLIRFNELITTSATGAVLVVLDGNRPNNFAPALSVATSTAYNIGSVQIAAGIATGSAFSINATSSLQVNGATILGASSTLVAYIKNGGPANQEDINQLGTGKLLGGFCSGEVQEL